MSEIRSIHVKDYGEYELLGSTRDDAAGEAYDKVARLLNLGYPGGPIIDRLAQQGDPKAFQLPEGKISLPDGRGHHPYDFSFSGMKTAVVRLTEKLASQGEIPVKDVAASFQATVAKVLTTRSVRCALDNGLDTMTIGGGVAANSGLRQHLQEAALKHNLKVYFPPLEFCTDNAAMIGCAAAQHFDLGHRSQLDLNVQSRMAIDKVMSLYH